MKLNGPVQILPIRYISLSHIAHQLNGDLSTIQPYGPPLPNNGSYLWTVSDQFSSKPDLDSIDYINCTVLIRDVLDPNNSDESDFNFTVI